MALDEEKKREIEERRAAAERARQKQAEVDAKIAQTPKPAVKTPSATAMAKGATSTSMTAKKVESSLAGYTQPGKDSGNNNMAKVVGMYVREKADINNMSYEDAMGYATRIVYDDDRDAFLKKWQKAHKDISPTMDEMRTYLNSQKPGGLYRESKDSYSKQVKENFKNDYTNIKTMHAFDGLLDISGNAVNMNTASIEEIERAIRFTANDKKRKAMVTAFETLTETPGNRFYGVTFDKSNTGKFLESSELTNKGYTDKMEYFRGQFDPIAGAGEANSAVYQELLKEIEESDKSDYVKRQFKDALDEVYTELIGGDLPSAQKTPKEETPAKTAEEAPQKAAQEDKTDWLSKALSWGKEALDGFRENKAILTAGEFQFAKQMDKPEEIKTGEWQGPNQRKAPTLQEALADEAYMRAFIEKKTGEMEAAGESFAEIQGPQFKSLFERSLEDGEYQAFVEEKLAQAEAPKEVQGPVRPPMLGAEEDNKLPSLYDTLVEKYGAPNAKPGMGGDVQASGSVDLTHDLGKAWFEYKETGRFDELTLETQKMLSELYGEDGVKAWMGILGDSEFSQFAARNEDGTTGQELNNVPPEFLYTQNIGKLGANLTKIASTIYDEEFPAELREDAFMAGIQLIQEANDWAASEVFLQEVGEKNKDLVNIYDEYQRLHGRESTAAVALSDAIALSAKMKNDEREAQMLSVEEAQRNERQNLLIARKAVISGLYTPEQMELVEKYAPVMDEAARMADPLYKSMMDQMLEEWEFGSNEWMDEQVLSMAEALGGEYTAQTDMEWAARVVAYDFLEDVLRKKTDVAYALGYRSLEAYAYSHGGLTLESLQTEARLEMLKLGSSLDSVDMAISNEAVKAASQYTGHGEGVTAGQIAGAALASGTLSAVGDPIEGFYNWMAATDLKRDGARVKATYDNDYGLFSETQLKADLNAMADGGYFPNDEMAQFVKEYLKAGGNPYELGLMPDDLQFVRKSAVSIKQTRQAYGRWAQRMLNPKQGMAFEVGSAVADNTTRMILGAVTKSITGNSFVSMLATYGSSSYNEGASSIYAQDAQAIKETGKIPKNTQRWANVMGISQAVATAASEYVTFGKWADNVGRLWGVNSAVKFGMNDIGMSGAMRVWTGVTKFTKAFAGQELDEFKDELVEGYLKDAVDIAVTDLRSTAGTPMDALFSSFKGAVGAMAKADDTLKATFDNAAMIALTTAPMAILGAGGAMKDAMPRTYSAAKQMANGGKAEDTKRFITAMMDEVGNATPEQMDAANKALHDVAVAEEAVVILTSDPEIEPTNKIGEKAQEQADAHAKSEENSMAAAEAGLAATLSAQERINNGEINPELVTQIGNGVAAHTKNSQSTIEHRREKEQKQAEADAAFAEGMKKATAKAEAEVSAREEAIAQETATNGRLGQIDARLKEIDGEYTAMLEADPDANMPPEMQQEIFDLENEREEIFANQTREDALKVDEKAVSEQNAEAEAAFAKEDAEANAYMEAQAEREKAQQEADEMKLVYQSLNRTQVYVDDTQKANILSRTGLKSLPQVNRKFGLKLTNDAGKGAISLDSSYFSELADLAPGRIAQGVTVAEDALMDIVERKKQLKGMQASVGETVYEKYLPDGTFFNIKDPVMQQLTSDVKKATGVDIVVAPLAGNVRALYDRAEKRIVINSRIGAGEISKKVVMHELTHYLEGGEGYAKYKDAVLKAAYAHDDADGNLRRKDEERILETYDNSGISLDEAGLESELVAEATEKIITDPDGYLTRQLLGQKQKGLLYNLAMKLRQFLARKKAQRAGNIEQYEMIQTAYERLKDAIMQGGGDNQNADPTVDLDATGRRRGEMVGIGEGGQMQFSIAPNQFANKTAQELLSIDDSVKDVLMGSNHEIIGNDERLEKAWEAVNARGADTVTDELLSMPKKSWGAQENVNAALCAVLANRNGDVVTAATILTRYDREGTVQGQALQARQLIKRLSPEGAMLEMIRKADNANKKKGIPAGSFPTGEDAPKKGAEKKREDGSVERVAAPVQEVYHEADELKKELDKLPTDVSYDNPWNLPLSEKMMALIRKFGLMNEKLPGVNYNVATKKQRMLAAILAMDPGCEGDGLKALCQQLTAINKGYAVVTVADLRYVSSQMMEFRAKEGPDATIPQTEEGAHALGRAYQALDNVQTADFLKQWSALRFANMLSAPATAVRNIAGNVIGGGMEDIAVRVADAIGVDERVSKKTGTRTTAVATREERKAANDAFRKEVVHTVMDYAVDKVDTSYGRKYDVGGNGRVFQPEFLEMYRNMVDFAMQIGDRPFFEQKYAEEMAIIKRLGMKKTEMDDDGAVVTRPMTEQEMHEEATMRALRRVFQEDNLIVEWVNSLRYKNPLADIAVTTLMPFIRTPTNVAIRAIEYSPVGLGLAVGRKMLLGIDSGKAGSISQRDYVMGIGRGLTGTGLAVAGWALASAGIIKFGREEEENKGRQEAQKAQNVPYGMYIQIGDTMREIDWAMPVASAIAIGADFHRALKDGSGIADAALGAVHSSVSGQIFDTPMMSAMNDIFRGYDSSENVITRYLSTGAESLLNQTFSPSIIRAFAKATDPYVRDTGANNSLFTSINKNVIQYWPGLRQMLPKATDITGDYALQGGYYGWNKETQNAALHFLDSFFTPTATIGEKNDDALYELVDLSYRTRETAFLPTTIVKANGKLTINKSLAEAAGMGEAAYDMHLTADERREFNRLYSDLLFNGMRGAKYETADGFTKRHKKVVNGDYLKNGIRKMMESGEWDRMTDDEKMDVVSAMKSAAKELVSYLAIKGEL